MNSINWKGNLISCKGWGRASAGWKLAAMAAAVCAVAVFGVPGTARGQNEPIVERLFRSQVVSVEPVFAPGQQGNPQEVVGFNVRSVVYRIEEPIEHGVIPRPRHSEAEPVGRVFSRLRCIGNARIDKSQPLQVLRGEATFMGPSLSFETRGTAIIHWCKNEAGEYNGVRWTDFSGTMLNVRGRDAGADGHFVGTRLLIGDPDLRGQSGLIIVRFRG